MFATFAAPWSGEERKACSSRPGRSPANAQHEAARDGAPPIELIDGDQLCDLLKQYRFGIVVWERIEEDVIVQPTFFNEFH